MSWNSATEAQMDSDVQNAVSQCDINFPVIIDRTPAAVLDLNGASSQITTAKNAIEQSIEKIRFNTQRLTQNINSMASKTEEDTRRLQERKSSVEELKKRVAEEKTLYELRLEQARSLKHKYDGNYHSSWLGLWRPLTDESRTGLLIASIVFGIIALLFCVCIGFLPSLSSPVKQYVGGFFLKRKYI